MVCTGGGGLSLMAPGLTFLVPQGPCIAAALALIGAGIALSGVIAFRTGGTTMDPTAPENSSLLVAVGIYRFTRNPMYLGFLLVLAGWATYLANAASVLALPVFVAYMNTFQIKPEERVLLSKFGAHCTEYMAFVRRWV